MNFRALVAEFIGTFALIFVGVGAIAVDDIIGGGSGLVGIALAHGLTIAVFASAVGVISGGYFNPAVTLGAFLGKRIDLQSAVAYFIVQCLGAIFGAIMLKMVIPEAALATVNMGIPAINAAAGVTTTMALICEIILTFFLVVVIYGTAFDSRAPKVGGLFIGLVITLDILVGGPISGAAMNPARHLGPALLGGGFENAWVYWVGPLIGGALGGLVYHNFLEKK
ncbi:MAG: MIP family channel protein [candidate division Zixibacteria bacterium]|nr:MIP family channel protein [candidate division Zixibacteria bacterium]